MSTLASNDIPVDMKKPSKVFTAPSKPKTQRKTQRKRKLTLKRRKVR